MKDMKLKGINRCECSDPGCPTHKGQSKCPFRQRYTVRRIDMEDGTTTLMFCTACAEDAISSGVFA